jgi:hypothetical protein
MVKVGREGMKKQKIEAKMRKGKYLSKIKTVTI